MEEQSEQEFREKIATMVLEALYPDGSYKELNGSELILCNMRCFKIVDILLELAKEAGWQARIKEDKERWKEK